MSFTRILSFSRSPMRIPSRRAVWLAVAGLLVFLATGAPASATNLLYVSLYYDTRIVSYDVDAGDGAAIAASRRIFATTRGNATGAYGGTGAYGVTFDHQGNLYASLPYSNIINKFDPTGVYLGDITSKYGDAFPAIRPGFRCGGVSLCLQRPAHHELHQCL